MNQLTAVILFSHGSLLCGSGATLDRHAAALRQAAPFVTVETGYLNYSRPSIEEAIENCRRAGASSKIVAPYYHEAGKFVQQDHPAPLHHNLAVQPDLDILLTRALEDAPVMEDLVSDLLPRAEHPAAWQAKAIQRAKALCELRESCPLFGSSMCRAGESLSSDYNAPPNPAPDDPPAAPHTVTPPTDKSPRGLLIILHGSPRPEANEPALHIAAKIRARPAYQHVEVAYLECNKPDIPTALQRAAAAGVRQLDVLPYFLHPGRHLVLDVPNYLIQACAEFPAMQIRLCPSIGESDRLPEVLLYRINEVAGAAIRE
jgi:sirohydrochlorin cobaltochelatase